MLKITNLRFDCIIIYIRTIFLYFLYYNSTFKQLHNLCNYVTSYCKWRMIHIRKVLCLLQMMWHLWYNSQLSLYTFTCVIHACVVQFYLSDLSEQEYHTLARLLVLHSHQNWIATTCELDFVCSAYKQNFTCKFWRAAWE